MKTESITAPCFFVECEPIEHPWFHDIGNSRSIVRYHNFNLQIVYIPGTDPDYHSGPPKFEAVGEEIIKDNAKHIVGKNHLSQLSVWK